MTFAQFIAFLAPVAPMLEKALLSLDQNTLQPWLKAQIAKETSPDIQQLLVVLDTALDTWLQAEAGKLG